MKLYERAFTLRALDRRSLTGWKRSHSECGISIKRATSPTLSKMRKLFESLRWANDPGRCESTYLRGRSRISSSLQSAHMGGTDPLGDDAGGYRVDRGTRISESHDDPAADAERVASRTRHCPRGLMAWNASRVARSPRRTTLADSAEPSSG